MQLPDRDLLCSPLPVPAPGGSTRRTCGQVELILEHARGGLLLLVHDGTEARRHDLAIGPGRLELRLQPPHHPVLLTPMHPLVLAPGGRLRGYFPVPLLPTVVFCGPAGEATLVEVAVPGLSSEWDDAHGAVHRCTGPFLRRLVPGLCGTALLPLVLHNRGRVPVQPAELPCVLQRSELRELRGRILAAPRRLRWDGVDRMQVSARPFPPARSARAPGIARATQGVAR